MSLVTFIDLATMIDDAGFIGGIDQADGIAIVCAESGRDPAAKHVNKDGSIDRGLWQINDRAHPEVTDAQAFDPVRATAAAFTISKAGSDYTPWSTWANGSYAPHLEAARVALDALSRIKRLSATNATLVAQIAGLQSDLERSQATLLVAQQKIEAARAALSD